MATVAERLAQADHASVLAAAGCGKTETIAKAVNACATRQLVLTHTHAGVNELRKRMHTLKVAAWQYEIQTIDGWALRLASAYPSMAGLQECRPTDDQDWNHVRNASLNLLGHENVPPIVRATYGGVFVDEYQDCSILQHQFVRRLAEFMPVRVLGDPLQGIFSFGGNRIVSWNEVEEVFPRMDELHTPHRWRSANADLGNWLTQLRKCIQENRPANLDQSPVRQLGKPSLPCGQGCKSCASKCPRLQGKLVLFQNFPYQCYFVAQHVLALQAIEEMACERLMRIARAVDRGSEGGFREFVKEVFAKCYTEANTTLKKAEFRRRLTVLADTGSSGEALEILEDLSSICKGTLYCPDLWSEAKRALQLRRDRPESYSSLFEAAWAARQMTRHRGRQFPKRLVSTTLLVKGQEFNHAVIADAKALLEQHNKDDPLYGAKHFYVAATRASGTLTIMIDNPVISRWAA